MDGPVWVNCLFSLNGKNPGFNDLTATLKHLIISPLIKLRFKDVPEEDQQRPKTDFIISELTECPVKLKVVENEPPLVGISHISGRGCKVENVRSKNSA